MRIDVLTLFPAMVEGPLRESMIGRALEAGRFELGVHDIRAHGLGKHRTVDDAPFGGGSGMVMRVDVLDPAIAALRRPESHVVLFDPGGTRFDQRMAERFATLPHLVLVCGHYEGLDARVRENLVDEVVSIGDFVLTGGEYAAMVVVDATARLLPGVLGNAESAADESFTSGMLEYPHYTRPRSYRGWDVPEILLSGDHGKIAAWRREQARVRTLALRPDLNPPPPPEKKKRRRPRRPDVAPAQDTAASTDTVAPPPGEE
ncbi:MAG: tRNA (guanosine(37)-N1)-methyltransferase TrmD [Myxococcota bacterium]